MAARNNFIAEDGTYDGRKPSFNSRGDIRGFRSRPGAPLAAGDSIGSSPLGRLDSSVPGLKTDASGFTPDAVWANFFRSTTSQQETKPLGVTGGDKAAEAAAMATAKPVAIDLLPKVNSTAQQMADLTRPTAAQYTQSAITNNEAWFDSPSTGDRAFIGLYGTGFSTMRKPKYMDTLSRLGSTDDTIDFLA